MNDIVKIPYHRAQNPEGSAHVDAGKKRKYTELPEGVTYADSYVFEDED